MRIRLTYVWDRASRMLCIPLDRLVLKAAPDLFFVQELNASLDDKKSVTRSLKMPQLLLQGHNSIANI